MNEVPSTQFERLPAFIRQRLGSEVDRSFTSGSLSAMGIRVAGTAILLLLQILLARVLGPQQYGEYIYVLNWINVLAVGAACGMDTASLRFVAAYEGTRDGPRLRGFLSNSLRIVLVASLVLATALAGCVLTFPGQISASLRATLLAACFLLPAAALLLLLASLLRGFKHVAMAMAPQFVLRPVLLGVGVLILYLTLGYPPATVTVMALDSIVAFGLTTVMLLYLWRKLPESLKRGERRYEIRLWTTTAWPMLAITAIRMTMNKVDILMIGLLLGTTVAGTYAVAVQLATLISFGLFSVNMVAAPLIAQLHAQQRHLELQRLVRLGALATSSFAVMTGTLLLLLGKPALRLFGPAFVVSYGPLCVLVVAQIANSLTGSVGFIMTMTGHEKTAAKVTALAGGLNVILALLLIPRFGALGAAIATGIASITWNVILVILVQRRVEIHSTVFSRLS